MTPGKNVVLGVPLMILVFAISAALLYGGARLIGTADQAAANGGGEEETVTPGGPVVATVIAKDLKFDKRSIAASPSASVTVTLDNQDAGVSHNIAFYTNNRATQKIAATELIPGVAKATVSFTAPSAPGNYFFRCDAHTDMTGTLIVK